MYGKSPLQSGTKSLQQSVVLLIEDIRENSLQNDFKYLPKIPKTKNQLSISLKEANDYMPSNHVKSKSTQIFKPIKKKKLGDRSDSQQEREATNFQDLLFINENDQFKQEKSSQSYKKNIDISLKNI